MWVRERNQSVSVSVKLEGNQVSSWCPTALPAKSNYKSVPRFSGSTGGGLDSIWCWVEQLLGFSLDWNWDWLAFFSEREPAGGLNQAAPSHSSHSSHWPHAATSPLWPFSSSDPNGHILGLEWQPREQKHTHHCDSLDARQLAINHH